MNELLIVDESDNIVGYGEKSGLHNAGILHRAFSIFIYHEKSQKLLLQRRAGVKYHSGGLWSNSCCSHPYKGEREIDGYRRCLRSELGNELPSCHILQAGTFKYYSDYGKNKEHEYDHVVLWIDKGINVPVFTPNPDEVEDYRWATVEEIRKALAEKPEIFTSWFSEAFRIAAAFLASYYIHSISHTPLVHDSMAVLKRAGESRPSLVDSYHAKLQYHPAFDQGKTGYCWLVSALYCISRHSCGMRGTEIGETPVFSKDRLIFFDKLEKANHFLNVILANINQSVRAKELSYILNRPISDRGHWNMAENLIRKYGLTPYESECDLTLRRSFSTLNAAISLALRVGAYEMRSIYAETGALDQVLARKGELMEQVKSLLLDYWANMTDLKPFISGSVMAADLSHNVEMMLDSHISVSCGYGVPGTNYVVECDGNVEEGRMNRFLELSPDVFEHTVQKQIEQYGFCQCSCDANKFFDRNTGHCGDSVFDFSAYMNDAVYRKLSRADRVRYHLAAMSHAIVLVETPADNRQGLYVAYDSAMNDRKQFLRTIEPAWFRKYICWATVDQNLIPFGHGVKREKRVQPWTFFGILG